MLDLTLAYLRYDPLVRIHLGPLSISPHGVGIAVGFLLGSYFFLGWCRKAGLNDDQVYSLVNRAAIGSIIGARVAYVINHPGDFSNPLEIFAVWKGGISLLGGIAGAILAGVPKMRSEGLSFWKVMDLAVPCVAMGIVVGPHRRPGHRRPPGQADRLLPRLRLPGKVDRAHPASPHRSGRPSAGPLRLLLGHPAADPARCGCAAPSATTGS